MKVEIIPNAWKNSKQSTNIYIHRLKSIWNFVFCLWGLDMYNIDTSKTKKIILFISVLIQIAALLHSVMSVFCVVVIQNSITQITNHTTHIVSCFISVFGLITLYRKRKSFAPLINKTTNQLNKDSKWSKYIWIRALLNVGVLFAISATIFGFVIADIFTQNAEIISKYIELYVHGIDFAEEQLYIGQILVVIVFFISLFIPVVFVNICVGFFISLCHIVVYRFKQLNMKLEKILSDRKQLSSLDLSEYRKEHQDACNLVKELSDVWSPLILIWIVCFIFGLCFDIRAFKMENSCLFLFCFVIDFSRQSWLLTNLFKVSSSINVEAHKLAENLVTVTISTPNNAQVSTNQMDYYVNYLLINERLINTQIGINVSGLFLLNASSFVGLVGTVLTYVIVLYQSN